MTRPANAARQTIKTPDFTLRRDDFSVQLSKPGDDRFWLRIEVAQDELIVTDFFAGRLNQPEQSEALRQGLKEAGVTNATQEIVFTDIHAGQVKPENETRAEAANLALRLMPALRAFDRTVADTRIVDQGGKVAVVFALRPDDRQP